MPIEAIEGSSRNDASKSVAITGMGCPDIFETGTRSLTVLRLMDSTMLVH